LDPLTKLLNSSAFNQILKQRISEAKRHENEFGLIMVKIININSLIEKYGYPAMNYIIKWIAQILRVSLRSEDLISRYGNNTFLILLPYPKKEGTQKTVKKLTNKFKSETMIMKGTKIDIDLFFNINICNENNYNIDNLLKKLLNGFKIKNNSLNEEK